MPNTLAHLGIHGLTTRAFIKTADLKWIYLGCIIPDLPWIFQRTVWLFSSNINLYDLRLYVVTQSTLLFCIILSAAFASLSKNYFKTYLILSAGSLIHLLLDAMQIKWANGVHLFAPFSWEMIRFDLFWPESFPTYLITASGLLYFLITIKEIRNPDSDLIIYDFKRWLLFVSIGTIYFLLPLLFLKMPLKADNHFVKTLSVVENRKGKYFEIDRRSFTYKNGEAILNTFADEDLKLTGNLPQAEKYPATLSIRAKFIDTKTAEVLGYRLHTPDFRDSASYLGLTLIILFWMISLYTNRDLIFSRS